MSTNKKTPHVAGFLALPAVSQSILAIQQEEACPVLEGIGSMTDVAHPLTKILKKSQL